jgi:hypothetical protein
MRTFALAAILLTGFGCTNIQPVGPLAKHKHAPAAKDADIPEPPAATAQKPVPPAVTIVPGEVNSDNAGTAAQKLAKELEYDWKSMPPPPKTAEISRYKNGVKQN